MSGLWGSNITRKPGELKRKPTNCKTKQKISSNDGFTCNSIKLTQKYHSKISEMKEFLSANQQQFRVFSNAVCV